MSYRVLCCLRKVNKHRKLANNALLPAPKWIPAVNSPNYISPTPEDPPKPLPCMVDGSMEGHCINAGCHKSNCDTYYNKA